VRANLFSGVRNPLQAFSATFRARIQIHDGKVHDLDGACVAIARLDAKDKPNLAALQRDIKTLISFSLFMGSEIPCKLNPATVERCS
jgi:hypothetical protein